MSIFVSGNIGLSQNGPPITATPMTASGGRTLTFAAGSQTITASSGSFLTDGYTLGGTVTVTGTSASDGTYGISLVTALVLTLTSAPNNEGPFSATVALSGTGLNQNAQVFGSEPQAGAWGHYMQMSMSGLDGDIAILWDTGPGCPAGFTAWGANGLSVLTKIVAATWAVGPTDLLVTWSVFDPADGTTLLSATRHVTADDADYVATTIAKADLDGLGFAEGSEVRCQLTLTRAVSGDSTTLPYMRVGPISADFGSGGGGGGGGGGGSGTVTSVTAGDATITVGGTATDPTVAVTGAALTKGDDTNVTLTLGGTPSTALVKAASITAGWTGQLAVARGGTGAATAANHVVFAGPTIGGPLAPSFRALDATDIPALAYEPTIGAQAANVVLAGPTSGGSATPTFRALVVADIPAGTNTSTWQVNADAAGPKLKDSTGALDVRNDADAAFALVRVADAVGQDDAINLRTLQATGLTAVYGNNLIGFAATGNTNTRKVTIPANTLAAGATGVRITVGARCVAGASDTLKVTFGGADILLSQAGAYFVVGSDGEVVVDILVMNYPGSPGTASFQSVIQGISAPVYAEGTSVPPAGDVTFTTTDPQDVIAVWANGSSRIHRLVVEFVGGIPANAVLTDAETPRTAQATSAACPTVMLVKHRSGAIQTNNRMASGSTVGGAVDGTIVGTVETWTQTAPSRAAFNDWCVFKNKEWTLTTISTTDHKVYSRPLGGTGYTLADTQTFTVSGLMRTGLHVVDVGTGVGGASGEILCYVFQVVAGPALYLVWTGDGVTWNLTNITPSGMVAVTCIMKAGVAQSRGVLYVPILLTSSTTAGFAINCASGTSVVIAGGPSITNGSCGRFCAAMGRVFWMHGSANAIATQRTLYEVHGGMVSALLALTSSGNDAVGSSASTSTMPVIVPIGDFDLLVIYPSNTGVTSANAFFRASKVTFASQYDAAPTETVLGSYLPAVLTAAGAAGGAAAAYSVFAFMDTQSDPGNAQIYYFICNGLSAYSVGKHVATGTTLTFSPTGVDAVNFSLPSGDYGGGQRFSVNDSTNAAFNYVTWVVSSVDGRMICQFKLNRLGSGTFTVKLFLSSYETVTTFAQATLAGSVTGAGASRVGNEIRGVADNTDITFEVDLVAMSLASGSSLAYMLKAYRE